MKSRLRAHLSAHRCAPRARTSVPAHAAARKRALAWFLAVALAALPAPGAAPRAQTNLPDISDESANLLTPQMERRIGLEYYRELRGSPDYLDDPEVTAYVQELGERLVAASPQPGLDVEFFLVKDDSINAFAMLGGFIGVNTGLLLAAQSESEAASVLGHELGHLIQKHVARGVSAGQKTSIASLVGTVLCMLAARSSSQGTQACAMVGMSLPISQQLAYSRDFEREADRIGFDILKKGGFDVTAMPLFFERLQTAGRVYDSNAPVYVRSHPLTTERIADVRNRAQAVPYRQHADALAFSLVRAKLRATMSASVDGKRDAVHFFSTQIAGKTYSNLNAARYGLAWALLQSREYDRAQAELAQIPKTTAHPMFDNLAATLLVERKEYVGAIAAYRAAAAKYPRARYLQLGLIDALQKAGRHDEALALLRDQAQIYRSDARVYEMQARSYGAVGKRMLQHQAQAESYAQMGRNQPAMSEFMVARCASDGDFYQQSIIDARMRALWDEMVEEKRDREGKSGDDKNPNARRLPPMNERPPEARC
ncbi:MAG: peptidase Ste24p [Betaproteobacteria bacterium]|nr:peptidase Ste24p [Betaproteobacteria bacterium]